MSQNSTRVFTRTARFNARGSYHRALGRRYSLGPIGLLLCVLWLALGVTRTAAANGRYPKADQLLVASDDPEFLVVRSTFGFLVSRDAGQNWDWLCERAVGYSGVQDPTLGIMEGGTIVASLSEGIARSADRGCNWSFSEADLSGAPVIDLSVHKDTPSQALALVWDAQQVGYSSRILASADNGRTFLAYGQPIDPSVLVTTLDTAASNSHRVYASGTRAVNGVRSALLFASSDDGEHWSEYSLPFDPKLEQGVYIAAVDPADEDTVYLRTSSATVGRLLVSHDGGQHVSVAYSGSLLSFALSPDGRQLYFGGEDGLHRGLASDLKFERSASLRVLCLAATADTVYACSDEHSGFTVGASHDGGSTFEPLLHLMTVRGPLSCSAAKCESDWPLVRAQLGIPLPDGADAGTAADGAEGGAAGAGPEGDGAAIDGAGAPGNAGSSVQAPRLSPRGSSCAFVLAASTPSFEASLAVALVFFSQRRRLRVRTRLPAR